MLSTPMTSRRRMPMLIYPGHDYIARNLGFTLDREPDNAKAKEILPAMEKQDTAKALVTTLALEREINTFFRLTSPSVIRRLREAFPISRTIRTRRRCS
jgi:hydroxyacylglutathione hydrolase